MSFVAHLSPRARGTNLPYNCIFQKEVSRKVQENLQHPSREAATLLYVPKHLSSHFRTQRVKGEKHRDTGTLSSS